MRPFGAKFLLVGAVLASSRTDG